MRSPSFATCAVVLSLAMVTNTLALPAFAATSESPAPSYRAKFATPVHAEPSAGSAIVVTLKMDETIEVLGAVPGSAWLVAGRQGKRIGYVFGPTVEESGLVKLSATETLMREQGIDRATAERLEQGVRQFEQKNWAPAYDLLAPLAEKGVSEAQFRLAKMYQRGHIGDNPSAAATWFERAADNGHPAAQNDLGTLYFDRGDIKTATALFRRAAEQEYCWAQVNLGGMYYEDSGTNQDLARAAYWFSRASRCDDFSASMAGDRWVRKLDTMARERKANHKNDVIAAGILLALALGVLGATDGGSSSTDDNRPWDPCDDSVARYLAGPAISLPICGK